MENISLPRKANFFESRVSDYKKHGVMESLDKSLNKDLSFDVNDMDF